MCLGPRQGHLAEWMVVHRPEAAHTSAHASQWTALCGSDQSGWLLPSQKQSKRGVCWMVGPRASPGLGSQPHCGPGILLYLSLWTLPDEPLFLAPVPSGCLSLSAPAQNGGPWGSGVLVVLPAIAHKGSCGALPARQTRLKRGLSGEGPVVAVGLHIRGFNQPWSMQETASSLNLLKAFLVLFPLSVVESLRPERPSGLL